jgi:hypothetical protein
LRGTQTSSPSGRRQSLVVLDRDGGVILDAVLGLRLALVAGSQVRATGVEKPDPLLDALERLHDVALEADQHVDCVLVGAASDLLGVAFRVGDDPAAVSLRLRGEPALVDEERRLLLRPGDDPLGLFLGLLDDPLALGVDALRRADLLGNGDAQLVDQAERGGLVDDDVARQREPLAIGDDRLEALDEEDDVRRRALRGVDRCANERSARASGVGPDYRTLSARRTAANATSGIMPLTSPPKEAISFTSEDDT